MSPPHRRAPVYAALAAVGALLFASVAAFGATEVYFRARGLQMDTTPHTGLPDPERGCIGPDLLAGYAPLPGTCGRDANGVVPLGPAAGGEGAGPRVLVLGDSISAQRRWVEVLDRRLRAAHPGLGTWNAGVVSYDTCQELATFERLRDALDPDVVVLQTCVNDLNGSAAILPLSDRRVRIYTAGAAFELPFWALRSRALTWLAFRVTAARQPTPDPTEQLRRCADTLRLHAAPAPVYAVMFPTFSLPGDPAPGAKDAASAEAAIAAAMAWAQLPALDLRPLLEAHRPLRELRSQSADDLHPNEEGARLAGEAAADWLLTRPPLGGP